MEILFCDRCHESIPDLDLESGKAVRVGGRLLHVSCALARSTGGPGRTVTFLLALGAAALAAWSVARVARLNGSGAEASRLEAAWKADIGTEVADLEPRLQRGLETMGSSLRASITREVNRARDEAAQTQRLELERAIATLNGKVDAYVDAQVRRLEANERQLQEVAAWVREVRDLATRTSPPVEEPAPAPPAPAPAPLAAPPTETAPEEAPMDPEAARQHEEELALWITRLKDPDTGVSFSATYKLKGLRDPRAIPPLVETLRAHKDYYTRLGAAIALGELRACDAVPALVQALDDKMDLVQTAASEALAAISGRDVRSMAGLTKKERRQLQEEWTRWWKENEAAVRDRLGQGPRPG